MHRRQVPALAIATIAVFALPLAGCGGDDEVAQYEKVSRELDEAKQAVASARQVVERHVAAVKAAEDELAKARAAEQTSQRRLAEVEMRLDTRATDAVLFRKIQQRLLEDPKLENVAIAARVADGVVSLSGEVPDEATSERALEVARSVPGAVRVVNQVRVQVPPVAAEAKK